jgi:rhamnogalacturonyl hydrolase YesR
LIKKNKHEFLRTISQVILGLQYYTTRDISVWADKMIKKYDQESNKNWHWFEDKISYDNGIPPMALLIAYQKTNNKKYLKVGLESLNFLTKLIFNKSNNYFSFPGNNGWFKKSGLRAKFDQQPIEVGSMVKVYVLAYKITRKTRYKILAQKSFDWFFGKNILTRKMVDKKSGGIFDGLNKNGLVNLNQGAESILSYLIAAKEIEKL